jgi:O-antigen/teichoic acid export membrane protein
LNKQQTPTTSLAKRYAVKLFGNIVGFLITLGIQGIVPRSLGPKAYGDFEFLTNFFQQLVRFLDLGTSSCFYNKLSKDPKQSALVSFYLYLSGFAAILLIGFTLFVHITGFSKSLFPDQELPYVYLAAGWAILTWFVQILQSMSDAYGVSIPSEIVRIVQRVVAVISVFSLFYAKALNLSTFFYYHFGILVFLGIGLFLVLEKTGHSFRSNWRLNKKHAQRYSIEFYNYCYPLFTVFVITTIAGLLERWLLQSFSGSVETGFYGLSYRIGTICTLFTAAMLPLIFRELSIAFSQKNLTEASRLFRRYGTLLYAIAAYFSCFIFIQADRVVYILGGDKFKGAGIALAIMIFYPVLQVYGQLTSIVFLASEKTKLLSKLGVTFSVIGIPVAYFLIAPVDMLGFNLGSIGLAVKMVGIQVIAVNVQLYYSCKQLGSHYYKYLIHQITCIVVFLALAKFSEYAQLWIFSPLNVLSEFLSNGVIYTGFIVLIGWLFPGLFGLNRDDLTRIFAKINTLIGYCLSGLLKKNNY